MQHYAKKRFGQNFLVDDSVIRQIVDCIQPKAEDLMIEIGPGLGAMTKPLLSRLDFLNVIELDRDIIPKLKINCQLADIENGNKLVINETDVLKFDFAAFHSQQTKLTDSDEKKLRIVGNLPYNISTPVLFHLLNYRHLIQDMHFMLQKEVAERMAAAPNTDDYGRLSIMVQWRCTVDVLFNVGPGAFKPAPKVESAVVRLTPHRQAPVQVKDDKCFAGLVNQAFSQRRKTLRNALKGLLTAEEIASLDIDPMRRPETLSLADYALLSNAVNNDKSEG